MADSGYIRLSRGYFDTPEWSEARVFSKAEAWLDLIYMASYVDGRVVTTGRGRTITINRGEIACSIRFLAQRWGWSNEKVLNYLRSLTYESEAEDPSIAYDLKAECDPNTKSNGSRVEIRTQNRTDATVITLCNYAKYNPLPVTDRTDSRTQIEHKIEHKIERNRNKGEIKKGNKEITHTNSSTDRGIIRGEDKSSLEDYLAIDAEALLSYVETCHPNLQQMQSPLTAQQALWIVRKYDPSIARRIFAEMDNKRIYETNANVYASFATFAKYDKEVKELTAQRIFTYSEMCDFISANGPTCSRNFVRVGNGRWFYRGKSPDKRYADS